MKVLMSDYERIIGRLVEFKSWTEREFKNINRQFELLRIEISQFNRFKWSIYGGSAVISTLSVLLIEYLRGR